VADRFEFEWRRPTVILYAAADRHLLRVTLNRYPGVVIGIAVHIGRRVLSIVWGRPGRLIKEASDGR
jgi:hypothetical protein